VISGHASTERTKNISVAFHLSVEKQIKIFAQMRFQLICLIFVAICYICVEGQSVREKCGRKLSASGQVFGGRKVQNAMRIIGGERVQSNEWPWLVVFVYSSENEFFCAGSLVSSKHVISGEIC
jgi:Trypsin